MSPWGFFFFRNLDLKDLNIGVTQFHTQNETINIQEAIDKFDKVLNRIKFKAFGKVTINNRKKEKNKEKKVLQKQILKRSRKKS